MQTNEKTMEPTSVDLTLDWDSAFGGSPSDSAYTDSIPDALIRSLSNFGRVDITYICDITGEDYTAVTAALKGSVFQNPDTWDEDPYKGWETAEEYLSGNLRRKLKSARAAGKAYPGRFGSNIYAIRKLLPEAVEAKDIYVTLGSPWVPVEVIEDFIAHILKVRGNPRTMAHWNRLFVTHDEYTGTWEIANKHSFANRYTVASKTTYGTTKIDALEILERTLNMKAVSVYDEVYSPLTKSGKKRVINQPETVLALEKQQKMIAEFRAWVWKDEKRKQKLEDIFDNRYGCVRRRVFDGSFLRFPGMSEGIELYPYQKDAVARILFSPNTLLAHDVGSGKTYVMIAAGMELRRMGISKKNLYVVPNNLVMQWKSFFEMMYPQASVFCVDAKNFTPEKRGATLAAVRDGEFDAVIMAYSCFDRIPLSRACITQQLKDARDRIKQIQASGKRLSSKLQKKKEQLDKEIWELKVALDTADSTLCFDALGFTRLFVDEAHNYKNVPLETKADKVLGISAGGSKKCKDMMDKVHFIQRQNNGGGVVMATGTPITNSLTDAFTVQMYLQSGELAMLDLQTFDSWIGMFAERVTEFEVDVDTNSYRLATRFSRFHNLPELTALLSSIADFHQVDECVDIPDFDGYNDTLIARGRPLAAYLRDISERAERVRHGQISSKEDNMLKITTDGRKAALDIRLVDDGAVFSYQSKVAKCAENAYYIYKNTGAQRSTQLIFCDTSTPKEGFNIYDEMKRLLVRMGVREEDIAFVHDATTETQRAKLFAKVRAGEIRILLGSTFKLGMGVNVQDRLIAIHHLDVPWRPADMTQREGRILRQGNQNSKVFIYRYITEGSFDAYSWQLLETKQRFISELLAGSLTDRSGSDVENTVLSYAEVKALAIGNPLVKQRVETANELTRVLALHRKAVESHVRLERELLELPSQIERQEELVRKCAKDVRHYRANRRELEKEERRELRDRLAAAITEHLALMREEDAVAMNFQGFDIVLPGGMTADRPYLWLCREGKYYLELGESGLGALVRVENWLEKLAEHHRNLRENLAALKDKQTSLKEELAKTEDYTDRIEELRTRLARIDKKLGVAAS